MLEGYYSGDKPNPNLRAFVEEHLKERPYNPDTDDYNVPAFDKPIETTKATAIYNMHTYWSKKPHDAIRQYIRHFTKPGDLVLDPMCGSGGTALAALMEGRKAIAIDRSPAATFISKNYCTPVDVNELQKAFEELKAKVKSEIDWLYETRCDRCGGNATTAYTVYSQVFQCPRCLEKIPLFDCVEVAGKTAKGKPKKINACPHCYKRGLIEEISTRGEKFGAVPVLVNYLCESGCKPAKEQRRHNDEDAKKREYFEKFDIGKLKDIEAKQIPYWYPTHRMMHAPEDRECWGAEWRPGRNFRTVDELFTKRNLWALSIIKKYANDNKFRDIFYFALTAVSLALSRMQRYSPNSGFPNMILLGTYYIPQIGREIEVFSWYEGKIASLLKGFKSISLNSKDSMISTSDVRKLEIPIDSVDYIFTDPPYAENVQYGELNFIWEAWLGLDTHWHDEEIIINEIRGKTEADWTNMMRQAMAECYRVLKPGRWISLCYHDTSEGTWALIQDIMAEVGFIVDKSDTALYFDTMQKSYNQLTADKVTKRDLIINFRKPKPGEISTRIQINGSEDQVTFNEKVRAIIREYLEGHPGAAKDRIYDEVVSRMVRQQQMEAHNFEELLRQVAEEVQEPVMEDLFTAKKPDLFERHIQSRWYLKETELAVVDAAESAKEDTAAGQMGTFIETQLAQHPEWDGVHYSDLFEQYVYTVKDKPRRPLAEWLLDYYYKTDSGTYRLPLTDEEKQLKAAGRAQGINRRIKRYLAFLEQGLAVPAKERPNDATLAEWIRHCKRSGMYDQGKLLFEKGGLNSDNLSEEAQVDVEEDYDVCVRMMQRSGK